MCHKYGQQYLCSSCGHYRGGYCWRTQQLSATTLNPWLAQLGLTILSLGALVSPSLRAGCSLLVLYPSVLSLQVWRTQTLTYPSCLEPHTSPLFFHFYLTEKKLFLLTEVFRKPLPPLYMHKNYSLNVYTHNFLYNYPSSFCQTILFLCT